MRSSARCWSTPADNATPRLRLTENQRPVTLDAVTRRTKTPKPRLGPFVWPMQMQLLRLTFLSFGRLLAVPLVALMVFAASDRVAVANASTGHHGSLTVRLGFRRLSGTVFWNSERYVFARSGWTGSAISRGVLIDDRTDKRRQLTFPPGCSPDAMGAGAVALSCDSGLTRTQRIYDITTGQTRVFTQNPSLVQPDGVCGAGALPGSPIATVVALGTRWVGLDAGSPDPRSFDRFVLQDRQTGQALCDPAGAHVTIDLNSAALTGKPCSPLTVPVLRRTLGGQGAGSLTALGDGFELAAGANSYLERCGTRLHEFLTSNRYQASSAVGIQCPAVACSPPANSHMIVWPGRGRILGVWLPSRQRFMISVPDSVDPSHGTDAEYEVGLTERHLYLSTLTHVWQAPIPTQPVESRRPR